MLNVKIERMITEWKLRKNKFEERLIFAEHNNAIYEICGFVDKIHLCELAIDDLSELLESK